MTIQKLIQKMLAHGIDDPNIVYIVFEITDIVRAKSDINSEAKKK